MGEAILSGRSSMPYIATDHVPYVAAAGSANVYTATLPGLSAYYEGFGVSVKINIANTGASSINFGGLGAKSIKDSKGADLKSATLTAGCIYTLRYNGTNFILQGDGVPGVSKSLTLIQSYASAGSYTWTVPAGVTKITVAEIGGGGSGAAKIKDNYSTHGGGSGEAKLLKDYAVTAGSQITIVVGAGGTEVSAGGSTPIAYIGNNGGSTSFNGVTVAGGMGGGTSQDGADGGQGSLSSTNIQPYLGLNFAVFGGVIDSSYTNWKNGASKSVGVFQDMMMLGIMPFCLCAGNSQAYGTVGPLILPNGKSSGLSIYRSDVTSVTAIKGTDSGCGGGSAACTYASGYITAFASPGCDGGVFIYVEG